MFFYSSYVQTWKEVYPQITSYSSLKSEAPMWSHLSMLWRQDYQISEEGAIYVV